MIICINLSHIKMNTCFTHSQTLSKKMPSRCSTPLYWEGNYETEIRYAKQFQLKSSAFSGRLTEQLSRWGKAEKEAKGKKLWQEVHPSLPIPASNPTINLPRPPSQLWRKKHILKRNPISLKGKLCPKRADPTLQKIFNWMERMRHERKNDVAAQILDLVDIAPQVRFHYGAPVQ